MKYNWEQADWPEFRYDLSNIEDHLFLFIEKASHLRGLLRNRLRSEKKEF